MTHQLVSNRSCLSILAFSAVILGTMLCRTEARGVEERSILQDPSLGLTRSLLERYKSDRMALSRSYSIPASELERERLKQFLDGWRQELDRVDFDALHQDQKIDWLLLSNQVRYERENVDIEEQRERETEILIPFRSQIVRLAENKRAMKPINAREAAEALVELTKAVDQVADDIRADRISTNTVLGNRAVRALNAQIRSLDDWHSFYDGYDPLFTWWTKSPYADTTKSLNALRDLMKDKFVGKDDDAIIGDPIGREALQLALNYEMIPYTPEELIEIANAEFAWCETEMQRAATDLGYDGNWLKALEHVKNLHVEPGEQPEMIRQQALEAIEYIKSNQLVTVPLLCEEMWRMEMMSPERQKIAPFFLGGETIQVSFPTDGMEHDAKLMSLRGNNRHFARATVHHELIPGHHLQGFMAQRYREHRRQFDTPFLIEGWALHWEMLLWDRGFQKSAEDRVGMLFWRSHRCARIIFSLKFHLNQMNAADCVNFLVERVGHERKNAEAEVRRSVSGDYGPLYQAAYMLGGLQMRALHKQLVGSGQMTDREFHDAVLMENSIPLEMIRASLLNVPLTKETRPEWRFYGDPQPAAANASGDGEAD